MTRYLAARLLGLIVLALAPVGCFESAAPNCTVSCVVDADCPSDLLCSSDGKCSTDGEVCVPIVNSCTAGEFLTCVGTQTQVCNQTGDGADLTECGAPGCNAAAGRCNTCAPSELACGGDELQSCSADGTTVTTVETCALGCAPGNVLGDAARCRTLAPVWIPNVCNIPAAEAEVVYLNGTLDTTVDTTCNGGLITQSSAPPICVIRYGKITFTAARTLTVVGSRTVAFVADTDVLVAGTLDVAAKGIVSGPGGGTSVATAGRVSGANGGGGAGFKTVGAAGGGPGGAGAGGVAGSIVNPQTLNSFIGGPRPQLPSMTDFSSPDPGGGGGGLLLVSCKGTVTLASTGLIDAGGGGGNPGRDTVAGAQISVVAAAGGGAGGHVVIQGAMVTIEASAQIYANGGGGGGGSTLNEPATGLAGANGPRSLSAALGGNPGGAGGAGGNGGRAGAGPTVGGASTSSGGGGGGATGVVQLHTPTGTTPTISSTMFSPALETLKPVPTR